jgi:hypothetical protein
MRFIHAAAISLGLSLVIPNGAYAAAPDTYYPSGNTPYQYPPRSTYDADGNYAYQYPPGALANPAANKAIPAKKAPPPPVPNAMGLKTETVMEVGASFSRYVYQEPDPSMRVRIQGLKYGLTADASASFYDNWFAKLDLRGAWGADDYASVSGQMANEADNLGEIRGIGGYDIPLNTRFSVSPYLGLGYRALLNDGRGLTSLGYSGYRRSSEYLYVPIGVTNRLLVGQARLSTDLEFDQLLLGRQFTELSDVGPIYGNINNTQRNGYGLRADTMYETKSWAIGPFVNYWNIGQSKQACDSSAYAGYIWTFCGVEPHNDTLEYGLQVKYRFYHF